MITTNPAKTILKIEQQVWQWLDDVVIGLNLCPFAKKPRVNQQIQLTVCEAANHDELITEFMKELEFIRDVDPNKTDTSVFVIANMLQDFDDYLDYLNLANMTVSQYGLEGEFQLASFHPNYQFEGTEKTDQENLTNTSPYPIIHIIREATVEKVLKHYPNPEDIPDNNIRCVESLTPEQIAQLYPFLKD